MKGQALLENPDYNPGKFLDWLIHSVFKCRHDYGLSKALGVYPSAIFRFRHRQRAITTPLQVKVCEVTGLPIKAVREKMGIREEEEEVCE